MGKASPKNQIRSVAKSKKAEGFDGSRSLSKGETRAVGNPKKSNHHMHSYSYPPQNFHNILSLYQADILSRSQHPRHNHSTPSIIFFPVFGTSPKLRLSPERRS